jgi:hypothetical protein
MTPKCGRGFKTLKQQGEWAQLLFMARAAELGLAVSQPYGDSASYDVGIENHGRLLRVQVKSVTYQRDGSFTCNVVGPGGKRYRRGCVDLFAIYLIPLDLWYIIPFEATGGSTSLQLAPGRKGQKYERYTEAWHLVRQSFSQAPIP